MKIDPTVGAATLIGFLEARLDEDEQAAREWYETDRPRAVRAIHEFEAKRRFIDLYRGAVETVEMFNRNDNPGTHMKVAVESYLNVLERIAVVYSDHPDYESAWKPGGRS